MCLGKLSRNYDSNTNFPGSESVGPTGQKTRRRMTEATPLFNEELAHGSRISQESCWTARGRRRCRLKAHLA